MFFIRGNYVQIKWFSTQIKSSSRTYFIWMIYEIVANQHNMAEENIRRHRRIKCFNFSFYLSFDELTDVVALKHTFAHF